MELRADLVVLLVDGQPVLAIVVEVQLSEDPSKAFAWPSYLAAARSRFQCDAAVLVFAPSRRVAAWASRPIRLGPGAANVFQPLVVGADAVPVVRTVEQAHEAPELAVLSATAHGSEGRIGAEVAFAATVASSSLPAERAKLYWDLVIASLNDATRTALEELMTSGHYEYQSDFARKYFAEGKAEGKAEGMAEGKADTLLEIFAARGLSVTDEQRQRIVGCTDIATLSRWVSRAVTTASVEEVLAD